MLGHHQINKGMNLIANLIANACVCVWGGGGESDRRIMNTGGRRWGRVPELLGEVPNKV